MSRRVESVSAEACVALGATGQALESYPNRELSLGSLAISRALPVKDKRLVGPWCFLDRFGPLSFTDGKPMDVAPHPHIGLQTVTWLFEGEVVHDDSLGSEAVLRPGGVNVMTAGGGITHAEQTPRDHTGRLNGVQLWVALTSDERHRAAAFQHVKDVPGLPLSGGIAHAARPPLAGGFAGLVPRPGVRARRWGGPRPRAAAAAAVRPAAAACTSAAPPSCRRAVSRPRPPGARPARPDRRAPVLPARR